MATYAYIRVSTQTQTLENQKFEITRWCRCNEMTVDHWITETISGTVHWEKENLDARCAA